MTTPLVNCWIEYDGYTAIVCFSNQDTERDVVPESARHGFYAVWRTQRWAFDHGLAKLPVKQT